ncbi:transposase domain-containing protein [Ensifer sp. ZNC0028]|uniref:transposase domain-containing protein n=1 Tax=Ensifer sp. ZNC0028 TaxID=1339236 RepID=UPI0009DE6A0B
MRGGSSSSTTLSTLIQAAKMNEVDPLAWLTQTLERIAAGWQASDIDALMPWNFKK